MIQRAYSLDEGPTAPRTTLIADLAVAVYMPVVKISGITLASMVDSHDHIRCDYETLFGGLESPGACKLAVSYARSSVPDATVRQAIESSGTTSASEGYNTITSQN